MRPYRNRLIIDFRPNGLLHPALWVFSVMPVLVFFVFERMISVCIGLRRCFVCVLGRPGSDLLSRVLRRSTIGAGAFHGRVRNGIGCSRSAITTRSAKNTNEKLLSFVLYVLISGIEPRSISFASATARRPRLAAFAEDQRQSRIRSVSAVLN